MLRSVWKIGERRGLKEKDKESLERNERERLGNRSAKFGPRGLYDVYSVFRFPTRDEANS